MFIQLDRNNFINATKVCTMRIHELNNDGSFGDHKLNLIIGLENGDKATKMFRNYEEIIEFLKLYFGMEFYR